MEKQEVSIDFNAMDVLAKLIKDAKAQNDLSILYHWGFNTSEVNFLLGLNTTPISSKDSDNLLSSVVAKTVSHLNETKHNKKEELEL